MNNLKNMMYGIIIALLCSACGSEMEYALEIAEQNAVDFELDADNPSTCMRLNRRFQRIQTDGNPSRPFEAISFTPDEKHQEECLSSDIVKQTFTPETHTPTPANTRKILIGTDLGPGRWTVVYKRQNQGMDYYMILHVPKEKIDEIGFYSLRKPTDPTTGRSGNGENSSGGGVGTEPDLSAVVEFAANELCVYFFAKPLDEVKDIVKNIAKTYAEENPTHAIAGGVAALASGIPLKFKILDKGKTCNSCGRTECGSNENGELSLGICLTKSLWDGGNWRNLGGRLTYEEGDESVYLNWEEGGDITGVGYQNDIFYAETTGFNGDDSYTVGFQMGLSF
ncbi:MAG: hypothetical protein QGI45_04660 [Myxococcota bacterium]|nr:hypothetical protein [Myxococcota bacterium]